jgi:predicted ATP-grasp superfamily ATP-dependent carboligase
VKPDVLLPVAVPEPLVRSQRRIAHHTSLLVPPYAAYRMAYDNAATTRACSEHGIAAPRVLTADEAIAHLKDNARRRDPVPLVVKPRHDVGGARGLSIVTDMRAAQRAQERAESRFGPVIFQEYIPGPPTNMRTVNVLFDRASNLAAFFTTRKIRQWPNRGGISALSQSTCDRDLLDMVLPLFRAWNWRGPAEVEIKINGRTGVPTVIEINPRFGGYLGFPAQCGINLVGMTCELARGEVPRHGACPPYRVGVKYLDPAPYLKAVVAEIRATGAWFRTIRTVFRELRGKKVGNYLDPSDVVVTIVKALAPARTPGKRHAR